MKNKMSRPQSLNLSDLDLALEQAMHRLAQVRELAAEECAAISGGTVFKSLIDIGGGGATTGMMPPPPPVFAE